MNILQKHTAAFFGSTTRIIRDGTGAYCYRSKQDNSQLGQYHDGRKVQPRRKDVYSIRPQFNPFHR